MLFLNIFLGRLATLSPVKFDETGFDSDAIGRRKYFAKVNLISMI